MDDFQIEPPLVVKDTPKPRRLTTLAQARTYVGEAMRLGRPAPWRELWHRLKSVNSGILVRRDPIPPARS
ncbi:MAG: hypothetical protein ABSB37_00055 [Xanthobacteraceae bacterium]